MLKAFLAADEERKGSPIAGHRAAENALMDLCEFMKKHNALIDPKVYDDTVATIQAMNLRPYRSYCREHLLDIGIENI